MIIMRVICIYYKNVLPLKVTNIQYLQECVNFEMKNGDKLCNFVALYRSPSQILSPNPLHRSQDEFQKFAKNLELNLDTVSANNQFINETTHLTRNASSCVDLIFTSPPNLVIESGVHSSLHENCHHQITSAKFNLKIYYQPPYERGVWRYQKANSENIRKVISEFPWERRFANSDVDEKVYFFNKTIKSIISNYIPHETIVCSDGDPPWINKNIKKLINDKNHAYKSYRQNENNSRTFQNFQFLQSKLNYLIEESKHKYHARLSPLLHENKLIIDFRRKAEIFNTFFAK